MTFKLPLMENNVVAEDRAAVIAFLQGDPILTQSANVRAFEQEQSVCSHSVVLTSNLRKRLEVVARVASNHATLLCRSPGESLCLWLWQRGDAVGVCEHLSQYLGQTFQSYGQ